MVKEKKDLEHDFGLIETKNMKIICKNIRHGCAWQSPNCAPIDCWTCICQKDRHGLCLHKPCHP